MDYTDLHSTPEYPLALQSRSAIWQSLVLCIGYQIPSLQISKSPSLSGVESKALQSLREPSEQEEISLAKSNHTYSKHVWNRTRNK